MSHRKPKNKGGRPCLCTIEIATFVAAMLAHNKSIRETAKTAGIGVSTLNRWLHDGRQGDPQFAVLAELANRSIASRNKFASFAKVKHYLRNTKMNPWELWM